ncbi:MULTISPECIES: hypothetical protein [unclassified Rhizobacter]|uniref:hypothetical protein n=1 Tax=unclassified Rhizobacter TaxID=2640088 RepID=UPI00190FDA75|nr:MULTISPECIES: hypothetical protein [unclassified Rhizobacter]
MEELHHGRPINETRRTSSAMIFAVAMGLASTSANAVDCGPYKVASVQAQQGDVLIYVTDQNGGFWKTLGAWSAQSTKPYMAVAQQAIAMDRPILLRYADGYSCASTDFTTQPYMVHM